MKKIIFCVVALVIGAINFVSSNQTNVFGISELTIDNVEAYSQVEEDQWDWYFELRGKEINSNLFEINYYWYCVTKLMVAGVKECVPGETRSAEFRITEEMLKSGQFIW